MKKEFWQDRARLMEQEQNRIIDQIERIEAGRKKPIIRPHLRFLNRVMDRLEEAKGNCQ